MAGINRVVLVGRLGQEPDIRNTKGGDIIANVSLATSDVWRDKDGKKQERTEWHRVSVFGKAADIVDKYMNKGDMAGFEGKLQTRKWQDKDGNDRYSTEVNVSGFDGKVYLLGDGGSGGGGGRSRGNDRDDDRGRGRGSSDRDSGRGSDRGRGGGRGDDDMDDSIPF